jgi:hypothetical protein
VADSCSSSGSSSGSSSSSSSRFRALSWCDGQKSGKSPLWGWRWNRGLHAQLSVARWRVGIGAVYVAAEASTPACGKA